MSAQKKPCTVCRVIRAFVILVAVGAGIYVSKMQSGNSPSGDLSSLQAQLKSTSVLPSGLKPLPEFQLNHISGQTVGKEFFHDKWSVLFFGYTSCPDVCPGALLTMRQFRDKLENSEHSGLLEDTQVTFVSVDPERDTPEKMRDYLNYFNPTFQGMTGEKAQIDTLTQALGVIYARVENKHNPDNYLVDHSASMFLVAPSGHLQALFSAPQDADRMVADYAAIRAFF